MDDPKISNREILLFSMQEEVGALARALKIFEVHCTKRKFELIQVCKKKNFSFALIILLRTTR